MRLYFIRFVTDGVRTRIFAHLDPELSVYTASQSFHYIVIYLSTEPSVYTATQPIYYTLTGWLIRPDFGVYTIIQPLYYTY